MSEEPKKKRSDLKKTGMMPRIEADGQLSEEPLMPPMPPDLPEFPPDERAITGLIQVQSEGEDSERQDDDSAIESRDDNDQAEK